MRIKIILALILMILGILYINDWGVGGEGSFSMFALCILGCTLVGYIAFNLRLWFDTLMFKSRFRTHREKLATLTDKDLDFVYNSYLTAAGREIKQTAPTNSVLAGTDPNHALTVRKILEQLGYTKIEINLMITNALSAKVFNSAEDLLHFILKGIK